MDELHAPEQAYRLAKAIASGKPRLISLILYGNKMVGEDGLKMLKDLLRTMDVKFDWHYEDLQSTLTEVDNAS